MTRGSFDLVNALLLSAMLVTTVWGQSSSGKMGLAERMSALRRGLTPDTLEASEPVNGAVRRPQAFGSSLFGRGEEQSADETMNQPRAGSNATTRAASQSPARSNGAVLASGNASLPGMGGSPLPQGKWTPSRNGSAARGDAHRETSSDYPVIRDVTTESPTGPRPRTSPVPSVSDRSSARHSPGIRPAPHIDTENLHRELTGSFAPSDGASPRTARLDNSLQRKEPLSTEPLSMPSIDSQPSPTATPEQDDILTIEEPESQRQPTSAEVFSRSAADAFGARPKPQASFGTDSFTRAPRSNSTAVATDMERGKEAFGEALQVANGGDPSVLVSNQAPIITADIRGPKQILIGRDAVYRVRLQNQGAAAAEGIVATVRIPPWAEVVDTVATQGTVRPLQSSSTPSQLEWELSRIDGRVSETLDVRLIPRESKPLELGISWTVAPIGSRAIVEVQEPKLQIEVAGPNEVLFAKPQVFKLTISNPGTGPAENVRIELVPPGTSNQPTTNHPLGDLQAGESKTVEIELTAREAGKLQVKAIAAADGGLTSDISKEIFCRKPELELDWRGSATQYAGTTATYFFRVRNPGTAPADDVIVKVQLPEGAEFASGSDGQTFDPARRQVTWQVGTLNAGDDNYMELKCALKKPGVNQLQVTATNSSGDLSDNATAETNVIALADLKLEVSDPSGAVAVGSPATYEIRVSNRGSSAAKDVTIVALFSEGIEPDQAEGAMYTISDGRVAFRPISELPAGGQLTIRIQAHALKPGTHVFRAEVLCSDAEIKLAAEETTRFYSDEVPAEPDEAGKQAALERGFEATIR